MSGSVNKVVLVGNLGKDPEIRMAQDGTKIAQLSVATSESWRNKVTGERQDRTEWHRVIVFNPNIADVCEKYLRKGAKVYVEGQLQTRKWTDQAGQEKYTTEIVLPKFKGELTMLDGRSEIENPSPTLGYMSAVNPTENSSNSSLGDFPF
ncbi:MAG: single-stranded DNA-binding protein [Holosporales bacterium]|nr:single-stranded DNA-binding protein [Holosporales bacterium]